MLNKNQAESIAKHLRDMAVIFDNAAKASNTSQTEGETGDLPTSKRGRKPGAVSDDIRCEHMNGSQQRCKNRATQGKVCGKHLVTA